MNKILLLILSLILVACSPQVTVTSEVTVTLPPPTQTPIPTPTLHPDFIALQNLISDSSQRLTLLPDGSIEDNGSVIPNLHVDQNGIINIIFNNEHVAIDASQITFDDKNGLTIDGYTLDENGAWVEAVTFEPMELSTEVIGVCDYERDIITGRLAWSVEQAVKNGEIVFPTDAHNAGWENRSGESNSAPMFLSRDSSNAMQLVNLCKINLAFMGLPDRSEFVASVAVLNTDGTTGTLHFFIQEKSGLDWFLKIKPGNLGITKQMDQQQAKTYWDDPKYAPYVRLYPTFGDKEIMTLLNELQISGIVSDELSKTILIPAKR